MPLPIHKLENSSSRILRAAVDKDKETIYLEFPNGTYAYHRESGDAADLFESLRSVKAQREAIGDDIETLGRLQADCPYTIGSEGSFCLKLIVGPRNALNPFVKLSPEEAAEIFPLDEPKEDDAL